MNSAGAQSCASPSSSVFAVAAPEVTVPKRDFFSRPSEVTGEALHFGEKEQGQPMMVIIG
jgi:hypothetical protein